MLFCTHRAGEGWGSLPNTGTLYMRILLLIDPRSRSLFHNDFEHSMTSWDKTVEADF